MRWCARMLYPVVCTQCLRWHRCCVLQVGNRFILHFFMLFFIMDPKGIHRKYSIVFLYLSPCGVEMRKSRSISSRKWRKKKHAPGSQNGYVRCLRFYVLVGNHSCLSRFATRNKEARYAELRETGHPSDPSDDLQPLHVDRWSARNTQRVRCAAFSGSIIDFVSTMVF